jgi:hypothetical protein
MLPPFLIQAKATDPGSRVQIDLHASKACARPVDESHSKVASFGGALVTRSEHYRLDRRRRWSPRRD